MIIVSSAAMVNGRAYIFWNDKVFDPPSFINWQWCTNLLSHWRRCRLKFFTHFITLENSLLSEGSCHCWFDWLRSQLNRSVGFRILQISAICRSLFVLTSEFAATKERHSVFLSATSNLLSGTRGSSTTAVPSTVFSQALKIDVFLVVDFYSAITFLKKGAAFLVLKFAAAKKRLLHSLLTSISALSGVSAFFLMQDFFMQSYYSWTCC